ncbi:serine/threonine-protein kinase [Labilithrix luteola]|uniref:serine/threonine-protein kinase n=1 Tax=Labilithrix luteola TaxID=1391654 RepID=UPI0011BAD5E8|nr:serine/threonine-protein kinase [Labilithrix luteola]
MSQPETALQRSAEESFEGQIVGGKYLVGPLVGSGGMGTVWLGQHSGLGTRVAIKFIRPQFAERADARRRFEIEARAAASVDSKHAVKVYDYGVSDAGLPYIVMEYLEGESLSETLIRRGPLPAEEAARIIQQVTKALSKAHAASIVHRDLKPDNIFLATNVEADETDGLPYVVKVVDFGIAKMLDVNVEGGRGLQGPTQEGSVIGTPNFMSPEQLTVGGTPGPLTDIWSLGACTFAAFTARIPFEGDVLGDIVLKVCVAPLPAPSQYNPDAPEGLDAWFHRACHREPAKRFQSVSELSEQLCKVCGLGAVQVGTLAEDRVTYQLRAAEVSELEELADEMPTGGMNAKTALLAGIIVGVTLMVGLVGFLAWREKQASEEADKANVVAPAPSTSGAH